MTESSTQNPGAQEQAAGHIVKVLRDAGYAAYFAGGCVRDFLLGRDAKDYDVATSALPAAVLQMFPRTFAVGAHFGVVLVASDADGSEVLTEVATFRNDGACSDGRHPDEVRFSQSAEEDVQRRDFTINGMLLDPLSAGVLDYVGGRADLSAGIIRAIGDPIRRFEEDKLRMLRAIRFAARFEFSIEPATFTAMQKLAPQIDQVSRERIREELTRMLTEGHARSAFLLLDASGLLRELLPEIAKMKGVEQPPEYHPEGDVWVHTLLLLEKLQPNCSPTLAWGTLLHDVGKPPTYREAPDRIRFDGHAEVGTRMAEAILKRLRFSNDECQQILLLVENHMRFGDVMKMKDSTLKRFFRLPHFEEHLALHRMDCLSSHGGLDLYDYAKNRYEHMPAEQVRPVLLVTGKDLIDAGYKPGPQFKAMLAAAEDAQLEGVIHSCEEGLSLIQNLFAAKAGG
jgi:putative nucleotidyltransferase with HDIG domain